MFKILEAIENIQTTIDNGRIGIENNCLQKTSIEKDNVKSTEIVFSTRGDKGVRIVFNDDSFLIVTTDDFIFKTHSVGVFRIQNLPEIVSLNEVITNAREYIENPEPNNDIDNTVALYLLNKTLLENAEYYNFDVADLKNQVREAALKTNSIGDLTIYD